MSYLTIFFIFVTFAAIVVIINNKILKLTPVVGITLVSAIVVLLFELFSTNIESKTTLSIIKLIKELDFYDFLLNGIIAFLLFASALKVDVTGLKKYWKQIASLATIGVLLTSLFIGFFLHLSSILVGIEIPFIWCLLFGAIISPTDPIAALAIIKSANAPKSLEFKLVGESLFNDGTAIVLYLTVLAIATKVSVFSIEMVTISLFKEIAGAILIGIVTGYIAKYTLKLADDFNSVIFTTFSLASGSYVLATYFHFSAPIATVIAGLVISKDIDVIFKQETIKEQVHLFWEFIDEFLNVCLFAIIGIEIFLIEFNYQTLLLGVIAFAIVCFSRLFGIILTVIPLRKYLLVGTVPLLSWGGIRGGISLALALAILNKEYGNTLVTITFICVILSGLVQGLTLKNVIEHFYPNPESNKKEEHLFATIIEKLGLTKIIHDVLIFFVIKTDNFTNKVLKLKPMVITENGITVGGSVEIDKDTNVVIKDETLHSQNDVIIEENSNEKF